MYAVLFLAGFFAALNITSGNNPQAAYSLPKNDITVMDQGIKYTFEAENGKTVGRILEENGFKPSGEDIISQNLDAILTQAEIIYIYHATPITIIDGGIKSETYTLANTVAAFINEKNLVLNELDIVIPSQNTNIKPNLIVKIKRRVLENTTEILEIPFSKITEEDPANSYGKITIKKEGMPGKKRAEFEILKEDGKIIKKKLIKETVLEKAVPQEELLGSRIVIGRIDEAFGSWYRAFSGMYAASMTYPRKSFVRVTNLNTNKSIIVKINDYGPTIPGRIIDLEATAFKELAPLSVGVIPVRVEQIL